MTFCFDYNLQTYMTVLIVKVIQCLYVCYIEDMAHGKPTAAARTILRNP